MTAIQSPCIGVCTLDALGQCTGCFRSGEEIANWQRYSDGQRARLMDDILPEREERALRRSADSVSLPGVTLDIVG